MSVRALTVRLPWATAIMSPAPYGRKDIENRTWRTPVVGSIAIHAATRLEYDLIDDDALPEMRRLAGHVLGIVQVVGCHREGSPGCRDAGCEGNPWAMWSEDPARPLYHWELANPMRFRTPIRAKGALQLWEPGPTLAAQIEGSEIVL